MDIKGSLRTTADFNLLDNLLSIKQSGMEIVLTPDQAEALADFIFSEIAYYKQQWSAVEGK